MPGHHHGIDSWDGGNQLEPGLPAQGAYDLDKRVQGRTVSTFEIPERTYADACSCRQRRLVKISMKAQRSQAIAQLDFPLLDCSNAHR